MSRLRVPDETVDNTLSPLLLDAAILGFCQGEQVCAGDDRKLIAHAIYRDKHVAAPERVTMTILARKAGGR